MNEIKSRNGLSFGDLLRIARQNSGFSLYKVGDDLGISPSYISRIENNQKDERGAIAFPIVMRLAEYLNINFDDVNRAFGITKTGLGKEQRFNLNLPGLDAIQSQSLADTVLAISDSRVDALSAVEKAVKTVKLFKYG